MNRQLTPRERAQAAAAAAALAVLASLAARSQLDLFSPHSAQVAEWVGIRLAVLEASIL